ncbi:MAG: ketohexokinase [Sedimenticola sp.]|nr:MAG: ketohexokinase [Sedimenticola sp.]
MPLLAIGVATLDIVNLVDVYPKEDEKVRAIAQSVRRGGNAANTLAVLSQLGHECYWAGVLAGDSASRFIREELDSSGIDCRYAVIQSSGQSPTSYITLSKATGSRTIVHHRQLREFTAADFLTVDLEPLSWVHFEGRNIPELPGMFARLVKFPAIRTSLEVEKPREGIERLFPLADLLFFSRDYVHSRGFDVAEAFLRQVRQECRGDAILVCPWGEQGAYASGSVGQLCYSPAYSPDRVIETLGAGDVFNAGVIDGLLHGLGIDKALERACRLAGRKCGQEGFDNLAGVAHE